MKQWGRSNAVGATTSRLKSSDEVYCWCNLLLVSTDVRWTSHLPMRTKKGGSEDGEGKNEIQKILEKRTHPHLKPEASMKQKVVLQQL